MSIVECRICKTIIPIPQHIDDKWNYVCAGCRKAKDEEQQRIIVILDSYKRKYNLDLLVEIIKEIKGVK